VIGNDVVDLRDADTDPAGLNPRFDARVLCESERERLREASDPVRTRWRLWAAKEAAYKAARRADASVVFSPARFRVDLDAERVEPPSGPPLRLRFDEVEGGVHALVRGDGGDPAGLLRGALRCAAGADLRESVRSLARERIAGWLGVAPERVAVRPRPGRRGPHEERIPSLWLDGGRTPLPLSLSHHGRLVAFACGPDPARSAGVAA